MMKIMNAINNPAVKKGMGIASAVFTGVVAVAGALADQKKAAEFEEMKKTLAELKNK